MLLDILGLLHVVSLLFHRSEKGSDNAPRIDTSAGRKAEVPEAIWEHERVGCMWAMIFVFLLLALESAEESGGVSRSLEG